MRDDEMMTDEQVEDWDGHNCGRWANMVLLAAGVDWWQATAAVLAVVGVLFNNAQMRVCFVLWVISNIICLVYHLRAQLRWLVVRDVIFTILAVVGWFQWAHNVCR